MSSDTNSRKNTAKLTSLTLLGLIIASALVLNFIAFEFNLGRADLTARKAFSLSHGSQELVSDLSDRMEITAYFTEDLPPPFNATERYVRDLLSEYAAASNGNITVRFVNPTDDETREAAETDGVQRVAHQVFENDAVSVREGYRGMVIKYLGETKSIPVIQDATGLEYTITMAIKEMVGDRIPVGVIGGHEGPSLEQGLTTVAGALPTYELREVDANSEIDTNLRALLLVGPATELNENELQNIDAYLMQGGSLGVFGGSTKLSLEADPTSETVNSGINRLIERYGVGIREDIVLDAQCSRMPMRGPMGLQVAVPYPAIPIATVTEEQMEHPAMFRIPTAMLPFTSSLELTSAPEGVNVDVLVRSSENSWRDTATSVPLRPRRPQEWTQTGDAGPFPLMVAISGVLPSAFNDNGPSSSQSEARVLVAGSAAVLRDEFMPQAPPGQQVDLSGALAVVLNSIDWLAADADLIAIRAKNIEDPPLEVPNAVQDAEAQAQTAAESNDADGVEAALEERNAAIEAWESKKSVYKLGLTLGIPFFFGLFGILRWSQRQKKRAQLRV